MLSILPNKLVSSKNLENVGQEGRNDVLEN
jgi:hypothetical protein